jgi:hypothetical protein
MTVTVQSRACDRCTQGVMDEGNDHMHGRCACPCHRPLSPDAHMAREGERRYESWLESLKDYGP